MRPIRPRLFHLAWSIAALVTLAAPLVAQAPAAAGSETPERRFRFTVFGGASFSKFVGSTADTANLGTRTGYVAGGSVDYELSPRFALGLEGRLLQMGAKQLEVTANPGLGYNLTYLDLGLIGTYTVAPKARVVPSLFAGPTVGFEMDCKQPIVYNQTAVLQSNCLNNVTRESPEFGFEAGIGLSYKMVFVTGQYLRSFSSLVKELDLTNNGFALTAGVRF